jgi:DNA gyrase subunit A
MRIIPAPDFPTGGEIIGLRGARDFYQTGHGSIQIRGKAIIEKPKESASSVTKQGERKVKSTIIVTELPYMVNKASKNILILLFLSFFLTTTHFQSISGKNCRISK